MNPDSSSPFSRPDAAIVALRPAVAVAQALSGAASTVGDFLHGTLRPVLKLQNQLLLQVVADFVHDHHIPLGAAAPVDQQRQVAELLTRNLKLRYTVVGMVTAMFTAEEYAFYRLHRSEINRRLLELSQRRVLDQIATLLSNVPTH